MTSQPPKSIRSGLRLLGFFINRTKNYGLMGDLEEMYYFQVTEKGRTKASLWFWYQIIRTILHYFANIFYWSFVMFNNYFKITIRNFRRHKIYSFINLSGLAVGLACCILILSYVHFELSYDSFHSRSKDIYRLAINGHLSNRSFNLACTNGPPGPTLERDLPEVEDSVRIRHLYRNAVKYKDKEFIEENGFWAGAAFFEIFSFRLLQGDPKTALKNPHTLVIADSLAKRYFGDEDPLGKILRFNDRENFTVTGVMEDVPPNSHLNFDMLCSFATYYQAHNRQIDRWMGDFNNYTYLLFKEGTSPEQVAPKLPAYVDRNLGSVLEKLGGEIKYILQPVTSIHLHSHLDGEFRGNSHISYIYIFSAIALFILLLACINFMNLSSARSANRAKEVGMRKVHGAVRSKLIKQFMGESLIYSYLSLFIALLLVHLILPMFRTISGREISIDYLGVPWLIPGLLGLALLVGVAAGSYPAIVLASFQPAKVLKSGIAGGARKSRFRSFLVIFQFTVSTILIIGTAVILDQVHFMKNKDRGFRQEQIAILPIRDNTVRRSISAVKQELEILPGVSSIGYSSHIPGHGARHNAMLPESFTLEESIMMGIIHADHDFLPTMEIELAYGRNFSLEHPSDSSNAILINETAASRIGWDDPIGKTIRELDGASKPRIIVGVIKDFHYMSIQQPIGPIVIINNVSGSDILSIKLQPDNIGATVSLLENKLKEIAPNVPFDYFFLDSSFENQFRTEENLSRLFSYFSVLAIFIACLGLFGMAAYNAEQRTKEVGIRKVLGASTSALTLLLSSKIAKLILLANLIAWPLAYLAAHYWLQNFAYHTAIDLGLFFLTALAVLAIGMTTTAFQSIKTSLKNPVDTLQHE